MVHADRWDSRATCQEMTGSGYGAQKRQDAWCHRLLYNLSEPKSSLSSRCNVFQCRSFLVPSEGIGIPVLKTAATLTRSYNAFHGSPIVLQLVPAVGIIAFAGWGLGPLMRMSRIIFLHKSDSSWKKSSSHDLMTSYLQPLLLWTGTTLTCRVLDPIILPAEASQAVKQRLLDFIRSLSTVLAFAYCLSSLIRQTQKFFMETNDCNDARNMGFQFAGKAVYTAVWVAAVSLFVELLGFSTQKWLTAGGLGTVLITLAGREIFTNFLSSVMIHVTRPFVANERIQTKIEGYEVSGSVEFQHVGWWSPTIVRGDDREAIHIPNHQFTINVVRNLSHKTHWRIKMYLAISHLDVNKINILVSCFVKTSHSKEYLCIKEAILLDLLRVVSHHQARLATPIRKIQKFHSEADIEILPFADTIFTGPRATCNRPLLLIEPSYKINGDDKAKASTRSSRMNEEKDAKIEAASTSNSETDVKSGSSSIFYETNTNDEVPSATSSDASFNSKVSAVSTSNAKTPNAECVGPVQDSEKQQLKKNAMDGVKEVNSVDNKPPLTCQESGKQDGERPIALSSVSRPALEDKIVLGIALEGSKQMLPIEEEMTPSMSVTNTESMELAASRNGSGSAPDGTNKKDEQNPAVPAATRSNQRQKER
ncbi:hypothetical protein HYC85_020336 [Camellia sinensis]|uniref:Mechanosensitive ion channel protein n=1 Tax=Camellia sinensis TaxID=4442 RepID=A0A7J7GTA9_CAMSI|nr:hypothetical protein HYC85_020336 [Camellia sinensis]